MAITVEEKDKFLVTKKEFHSFCFVVEKQISNEEKCFIGKWDNLSNLKVIVFSDTWFTVLKTN